MSIKVTSIFDAFDDVSLADYVYSYAEKKDELKEQFKSLPKRETEFSAGYDLACVNDEVIPAHTAGLVTFGYSIEIDAPGVMGVVVPRSSLAKKRGLIMSCGPYYIYSDQPVISCRFYNFTDQDVELKSGDKIAQVLFVKSPQFVIGQECWSVDPLDETVNAQAFDNNLESIAMWGPSNEQPFLVDQTDLFSFMFQSPEETVLEPGKVICIMTKLRCKLDPGEVLILQNAFDNSCVELANTLGVIDADYYDNPDNGGEIGVLLLNRGCQPIKVNVGDVLAKGSIFNYSTIDGDEYGGKRTGGFGSTDK